jgi:hypothetical protein
MTYMGRDKPMKIFRSSKPQSEPLSVHAVLGSLECPAEKEASKKGKEQLMGERRRQNLVILTNSPGQERSWVVVHQ